MPFDLPSAANRLRHLHSDPLPFRRALLDVAFAAGCPVSEQAVALEHGDAVTLRMASSVPGDPRLRCVVLDLDPPGHRTTWPATLDGLGGPVVAQTWAIALHTLVRHARELPWELIYTRGPAMGVPTYVQERLQADDPTVQVAPCPSQPSSPLALDGVSLTLRRAENVWRLPACDWTIRVEVVGAETLPRLRAWLRTLHGAWTLHALSLSNQRLTAILRTERPVVPPEGIALHELSAPPPLAFPVNDALLAWPADWLPSPMAARTLTDGLWLAGVTPEVADDAALPEVVGGLTAEWQIEPIARAPTHTVHLAVSAAEAAGPVAASGARTVWHLPGALEANLAVRGLKARLAAHFKAQ